MRRRRFLGLVVGSVATAAAGCTSGDDDSDAPREPGAPDAGDPPGGDAAPQTGRADGAPGDPCAGVEHVNVYDTYAQALYLDGSLGPLTGIIYADYVAANEPITLDFWHGHGGQLHRFTLGQDEFSMLKQGERVYVTTTEVDSHMHMLFIDPLDLDYRVEGAEPVSVPLEDC